MCDHKLRSTQCLCSPCRDTGRAGPPRSCPQAGKAPASKRLEPSAQAAIATFPSLQGTRFWAGRSGAGRQRVPPLSLALPHSPECPVSLPGLSLSPSRYKAWESQPAEIRSQFQPVPTERSYQDGTCRMEYFKLYLSPDRGRLIAAPSRGGGGRGSREVAAPPATPVPALWADPLSRPDLQCGSRDAGARPAGGD